MQSEESAIIVDGVSYDNIKDLARAFNLKYTTVRARIKNLGWTYEQAVNLKERKVEHKGNYSEVTVQGNTFKSMSHAAIHYGFKPERIMERIRRGWTIDEAFELVERSRPINNRYSLTVGGKVYENQNALAAAFNLSPNTLKARVSKQGWTYEQAVGLEERPREIKYTVCGLGFESMREVSEHFGVLRETLHMRWNKGLRDDDLVRSENSAEKPITVEGTKFKSIAEACRVYDKVYATIKGRLDNGWTPEQAFLIDSMESTADYTGFIYKIEVDGKPYVGQTRRDAQLRLSEHFECALSGDFSDGSIHEAIRNLIDSIGEDLAIVTVSDAFEILEEPHHTKLNEREMHFIKEFDSFRNGYNLNEGTHGIGTQHGKAFFVGNIRFKSIAEAARHYGIKHGTLLFRLKSGISPEEAVNPENRLNEQIEFRGVQYETKKSLAESFGVSYTNFHNRYEQLGWTIEQALELEPAPARPFAYNAKEIEYKGNVFNSLSHIDEYLGRATGYSSGCLSKGWSLEEIFGDVERPKQEAWNRKEIEYDGVVYPSQTALADAFGIERKVFEHRLKSGWELKDALKNENHSKRSVQCEGVQYDSIRDLARAYKLDGELVWGRINRKWTPEQAVGVHPEPNLRSLTPTNAVKVEVEGVEYSSVEAVCSYYGVDKSTYYGRLNRGATIEQALGLEEMPVQKHTAFTLNGVYYASHTDAERRLGLPEGTISSRLKLGKSIQEACAVGNLAKKTIEYKGVTYESMQALAKHLNVPYKKLHYHVKTMKRSIDDAVERIG
ncbi:GIY-YIG nuclease family protein [Vibrio harveyi]